MEDKTQTLTPHKLKVLCSLKQSVKEMTLIKQGKLKGRNAKDLLNEL